jgi:hypothetical protein
MYFRTKDHMDLIKESNLCRTLHELINWGKPNLTGQVSRRITVKTIRFATYLQTPTIISRTQKGFHIMNLSRTNPVGTVVPCARPFDPCILWR